MEKIDFAAIVYKPIGIIHSAYQKGQKSPPPQGIYEPDSVGYVDIYPEYSEGLKDLDGFSHLVLLFHFHLSTNYDLVCYPRGDNQLRGVFATRSPRRPNPIGCSVVELVKIEKTRLFVKRVDMYDGTPLLDIKPYVPVFDEARELAEKLEGRVRLGWLSERLAREKRKGMP